MASGYLILCARRAVGGEVLHFIASDEAPDRAVARLEASDPHLAGAGPWRLAEFEYVSDMDHALARAEAQSHSAAWGQKTAFARPAARDCLTRLSREDASRIALRTRQEAGRKNPYRRPPRLSGPEGRLAADLADAILGARLTPPPLEAFLSEFAFGYAWSALTHEAGRRKLPSALWPALLQDVVLRRWGVRLEPAAVARMEALRRTRPAEFRLGEFAFARALRRGGSAAALETLHPLLRAPLSHMAAALGDYRRRVLRTVPMRLRRGSVRVFQIAALLGLALLAETAALTGGTDGAIAALTVLFIGGSGLIAADALRIPDFAARLGALGEGEWRSLTQRAERSHPYTLKPLTAESSS
jgi:hypothetical protein